MNTVGRVSPIDVDWEGRGWPSPVWKRLGMGRRRQREKHPVDSAVRTRWWECRADTPDVARDIPTGDRRKKGV